MWHTTVTLLLLASSAGAATTIPWDQADRHVGEAAVVEGQVVDVHCSPLSCLLAFEPSFTRFTAVVPAKQFDVLPPEQLPERYAGRRVRVTGTIRTLDGKPEIVVEDATALALAEPAPNVPEPGAVAQVDLLERLAAVLERLEALTEQLSTTQERTNILLSQLEQRAAHLASVPAAPLPTPAMNFGDPKPRPGYESLRTVKRGMSQADVQRLIGAPDNVQYGSGGWVTWYYAFGNSVSFDSRGRARSLVGFPNP